MATPKELVKSINASTNQPLNRFASAVEESEENKSYVSGYNGAPYATLVARREILTACRCNAGHASSS